MRNVCQNRNNSKRLTDDQYKQIYFLRQVSNANVLNYTAKLFIKSETKVYAFIAVNLFFNRKTKVGQKDKSG